MKALDTIKQNKAVLAVLTFFVALVFMVSNFVAPQPNATRAATAVMLGSPKQAVAPPAKPAETIAKQDTVLANVKEALVRAEPKPVAELKVVKPSVETGREIGAGVASFYGKEFAGRPTANGERFNPAKLTAAHRSLPFGSRVRVTNVKNGKSVVVRVNDRGPFVAHRVIDVSRGAAQELGMISSGTARVKLEVLQS